MIIRKEQMQPLGQAALRAFEDEMVVHLADFSPPFVPGGQRGPACG
jgi:hypothetical protein